MTRLTEQEIALIQRAQRNIERERTDTHQLLVTARDLRAEMLGRFLRDGLRALAEASGIAALAERLTQWIKQGRTRGRAIDELRRMDDRQLLDIGLDRGMVVKFAEDLVAQGAVRPARKPGLIGRFRAWLKRSATIRELSALDDHVLADIGLRREQIPAEVERLFRAEQSKAEPKAAPASVTPRIDRETAREIGRTASARISDLGFLVEATRPGAANLAQRSRRAVSARQVW